MQRRLDLLLEKLLGLMRRSELLTRIARRVLLFHYIRKGLERIYRFYAVVRFEEGFGDFVGGRYLRPRIAIPSGHVINVEICGKNLLDIKRILDKEGMRYWLMFGTFLGAYRDQAIIPYDEDTDLAIFAEDLPKLVGCEDAFHKEGFYFGLGGSLATLYRSGEHTDFYRFHLEGNKRVWKSIEYDVSAFETFNEIPFLGQKWRILSEPERWLKYTYGADWRTPIKDKGVPGYAYGAEFESGDK